MRLKFIKVPQYRRLECTVDFEVAMRAVSLSQYQGREEEKVGRSCDALREALGRLNHDKYLEVKVHLESAVNGRIGTVR